MLSRIVVAMGERSLADKVKQALSGKDAIVDVISGKRRIWGRLTRKSADLFVLGRDVIPKPEVDQVRLLCSLPDSPMVMVLSDRASPEDESDLLAAGSQAVLHSGLEPERLSDVLTTLLARREESRERQLTEIPRLTEPHLADFVSASPAMQAFMGVVRRIVNSDVSLLITGETGVGKERLARAIHTEGPRSDGPFVAVNCGALPETLLESELFGHEEGAFTGASRARRGWFEVAHRGAIFLDEIGEMPYHLQVKLLRALQEREIQRVGGERCIHVDVRIIAATNQDIEEQVEARAFRKDLYYRLSVVTLAIPPLRERIEDIPDLVQSYVDYFQTRIGVTNIDGVKPEVVEAMQRYAWPGNVRELINVVERAMLLCSGDRIGLDDLPHSIRTTPADALDSELAPPIFFGGDEVPEAWLCRPWREVREALLGAGERAYLAALLRKTGGRIGETALRAGMRPRSLYDKMRGHGLCKEDYRE